MSNTSRAQDYLMQIVSAGYGFDVPEIQNALVQTNHESVQAAVQYLFSNQGNNNTSTNTSADTQNTQNIQNSGNTSTLLQRVFGVTLPNFNTNASATVTQQIFNKTYRAYSPSYWNSPNKNKLECGDKIVMPASALEELSRMNIQFPILFNIKHTSDILPKQSHCGVLEFTAPEGIIYLATWMIDNLGLDANGASTVQLTTVTLPKGTFVQLQPHETNFTQLLNPRVVLEKSLRSYSCLTVGDTIQIEFANYIYKLDVIQVKPVPAEKISNTPAAICIIETDLKVDFMEACDSKTVDMDIMVKQKQQEKKEASLFLWRMTLESHEKNLLMTGYIRRIVNTHITGALIEILIKYADHWAVLDDIIKCKPYTKHESDVFDVYGVKLQLEFLPNGDPDNKTNSETTSGSRVNVLKVGNSNDVVLRNGDNSCILLSPTKMEQLGLFRGDTVLIKGNTGKQTLGIALINAQVDDQTIKMNDVVRQNIDCEYGDNVRICYAGEVGYGGNIHLAPLKDTIINIGKLESRPFGAGKYGGKYHNKKPSSTESIANELWNNYVKPYFQDAYRPIRIGDIYKIYRMNVGVEFEVVDLNVLDAYGDDDNVCIVAPETVMFIEEAIERERKCHIDRPLMSLCLKSLPANIKDANIKFEIEIKELNKTWLSTCCFSHNNLKFIQKQSKLIYTSKLKDCNQITFALKIQSIKLTDFEGNDVDIAEYIRKCELIAQKEKEKKDMLIQKSEVDGLQKQIKCLKELNEIANKRISGLETENRKMVNKLSIIQHEKKELEIENLELKNEIKQLKFENLNVKEYEHWDSSQLIYWIISLESQRFVKYENTLESSFIQQNVDGSCLGEVDRNDIMSWGIRDFKESKSLLKHIKSLVNHTNQNDDTNEGASTAFH